jgi:hypothetical protein
MGLHQRCVNHVGGALTCLAECETPVFIIGSSASCMWRFLCLAAFVKSVRMPHHISYLTKEFPSSSSRGSTRELCLELPRTADRCRLFSAPRGQGKGEHTEVQRAYRFQS